MRRILLGLGIATFLAGCGDPLRDIARLSDVAVEDSATSVVQTPTESANTGGGLFSRLLNRQPEDPANAAVASALAETDVVISTSQSEATITPASSVAEPQSPRRGLRGLRGVFGRTVDRDVARTGPDAADVEPATALPFGQIARVCGLADSQLGTRIDGGGGFRIYDTIPQSTAPRPFYITGFNDNCARTFTGAVIVTGDVETHEFVRYQPSNERIPYTTTDNAYEALKASVCRVGRGQPCGENLERMNSNTQFITVYDFFGGTFSAVPTKWAQILVNDGEVLAMSIKNGG